MTTLSFRLWLLLVLTLTSLLAACGGGDGGSTPVAFRDKPLPIDDSSPAAYTIAYLNAHPNELVQPEHLIIVTLDPTAANQDLQSVRLHIRDSMTLSINSTGAADVLSEVSIEDSRGQAQISHRPRDAALTFNLPQGAYRLVFKAGAQLKARQTLFLKLAETPSQNTQRSKSANRDASKTLTSLHASPSQAATALGSVSTICIKCSFDRADLSYQDLSYHQLGESTFIGTNLSDANMKGVSCMSCIIAPSYATKTDFSFSELSYSTLQGGFFSAIFNAASMNFATLKGTWIVTDLSSAGGLVRTSLINADLTAVHFADVKLKNVDFTGAIVKDLSNLLYNPVRLDINTGPMTGIKFDHMTPSNLWAAADFTNIDLTGTSFAGMDMSHNDFSVGKGVTVDSAMLSSAILSNGTTGANLSGQNMQNFKGWAASADGTVAGKDLRGVNLTNANLFQADLTGVNLSNAILIGADLTNSSLKAAQLVGAQLGVAPDSGYGVAANLTQAYMPLVNFTDADLRSVKLDGAHAYGNAKFVRTRLDSASLTGANLAEADFSNSSLTNTNFTQSYLINSVFSSANLQNASLLKSYLQGASFVNMVSVAGVSMIDAYVSPQTGSWSFTEADGTPFVYGYNPTVMGDLAMNTKGTAICPNGQYGPCTNEKLLPTAAAPYPPPPPPCIPVGPDYDNCLPPALSSFLKYRSSK